MDKAAAPLACGGVEWVDVSRKKAVGNEINFWGLECHTLESFGTWAFHNSNDPAS